MFSKDITNVSARAGISAAPVYRMGDRTRFQDISTSDRARQLKGLPVPPRTRDGVRVGKRAVTLYETFKFEDDIREVAVTPDLIYVSEQSDAWTIRIGHRGLRKEMAVSSLFSSRSAVIRLKMKQLAEMESYQSQSLQRIDAKFIASLRQEYAALGAE